ncbi:MAG: hypothetical protein ABJ004_02370 [Cyclobacteriaceae bacterium]
MAELLTVFSDRSMLKDERGFTHGMTQSHAMSTLPRMIFFPVSDRRLSVFYAKVCVLTNLYDVRLVGTRTKTEDSLDCSLVKTPTRERTIIVLIMDVL